MVEASWSLYVGDLQLGTGIDKDAFVIVPIEIHRVLVNDIILPRSI